MKHVHLTIILLTVSCIKAPEPKIHEYVITSSCKLPGYARDVYVKDGYAYVANGQAGLVVVRLDSFKIISRLELRGYARTVYVMDSFAYVATEAEGFVIVDVKDPYEPKLLGYDAWFTAYDLHTDNDTLVYIAASYWFIEEYVGDPNYPMYRRRCTTPGDAHGVYVVGGYAYVACEELGLTVIHVENRDSLARVGFCDTPSNARDLFVSDTLAYVADGRGGLQIIDVSDPYNPYIVAGIELEGYANRVYVKDDKAYVAAGSGGLKIVDVSDPAHPYLYGECITSYATSVFVDSLIYVTDRDMGLLIIQEVE